eukprot:6146563-Amphidinium_carterae.1
MQHCKPCITYLLLLKGQRLWSGLYGLTCQLDGVTLIAQTLTSAAMADKYLIVLRGDVVSVDNVLERLVI